MASKPKPFVEILVIRKVLENYPRGLVRELTDPPSKGQKVSPVYTKMRTNPFSHVAAW